MRDTRKNVCVCPALYIGLLFATCIFSFYVHVLFWYGSYAHIYFINEAPDLCSVSSSRPLLHSSLQNTVASSSTVSPRCLPLIYTVSTPTHCCANEKTQNVCGSKQKYFFCVSFHQPIFEQAHLLLSAFRQKYTF